MDEAITQLANQLRALADKFDAGELTPDVWEMNLHTGERDNFMTGCVECAHTGEYNLIITWKDHEKAKAFIEWTQEAALLNLESFIESRKAGK